MEGAKTPAGSAGQARPCRRFWRRGGSPHAPRKAKQPGMESNSLVYKKIKGRLMFHSAA
ncbi:hypothetical protein SD78_3342 [Bacillus badius]|nr:hypothetical protein SD78_3342 [Bacillus badius]